jgi:hypothetical protein
MFQRKRVRNSGSLEFIQMDLFRQLEIKRGLIISLKRLSDGVKNKRLNVASDSLNQKSA